MWRSIARFVWRNCMHGRGFTWQDTPNAWTGFYNYGVPYYCIAEEEFSASRPRLVALIFILLESFTDQV